MIPYFYAAGHINYARYRLFYLGPTHKLPRNILDAFMKEEHVMLHRNGL